MKTTINITKEIEKAQNELDDCIKSLSVLDNAVACGFLFDRHSLEMLKWIKEYKFRIGSRYLLIMSITYKRISGIYSIIFNHKIHSISLQHHIIKDKISELFGKGSSNHLIFFCFKTHPDKQNSI